MEKLCYKITGMKKFILTLFLIFSFTSSVCAMTYEEATTQNKPIVVMFKMLGCSACKAYEPTFDSISSKYSNKFTFVKEDAYSQLATKLNIQRVPTLYIIEPSTQKAYRIQSDTIWQPNGLERILNNYKK